MITADQQNQLVKGISENFTEGSKEASKKTAYNKIFAVKDTKEYDEIFTSTEGMNPVQELTENGEIENLNLGEGYTITVSAKEFAGQISTSEKLRIRAGDNTTIIDESLTEQSTAMMNSMLNNVEIQSHRMLNEGIAALTDANDPILSPSGETLLSNAQKWNSSSETYSNLLTGAFSETVLDELETYSGNFTDSNGTVMPLSFDTLVVKKGSATAREARRLFMINGIVPTTVANINIYEGAMTVIETPYITAANQNSYFFHDSTAQIKTNSAIVHFTQRPNIKDTIVMPNLEFRNPVVASYKIGIVSSPFDWAGAILDKDNNVPS